MRILARVLTTALGLAVAAWLLDGVSFPGGARDGLAAVGDDLVPLVLVAVILGLVTSIVKPVLTILSIPLIILSLGLFLLVINAAMLALTSALADALGIDFVVEGFWTAVGAAIIVTIVTWVVDGFVGDLESD